MHHFVNVMLSIDRFVSESITSRSGSMFAVDIEANKEQLKQEIEGKSLLVIGGAGSIGSSYIRAVLPFKPSKLVVVDLSENGLVELTRDLRSTHGMYIPKEYCTYTLNFADPIFERIFREEKGFSEIRPDPSRQYIHGTFHPDTHLLPLMVKSLSYCFCNRDWMFTSRIQTLKFME